MSEGKNDPDLKSKSLKHSWDKGNEYVLIDHSNIAVGKDLLALAYNDLYATVFTPESGGEAMERWVDHLENKKEVADYRVVIAGRNLQAANDNTQIKGMAVSIYYPKSDTGLLAYIVTDKKYRAEGLGKKIFSLQAEFLVAAAQEYGQPLRGWFIECNDPAKSDHNYDGYDAQKLVNKYLSWGCRKVPVDYVVPDTADITKKVHHYMLLEGRHPVTGLYPDEDAALDYIASIYREMGIDDPANDSHFQSMKKQMDRSGPKGPAAPQP